MNARDEEYIKSHNYIFKDVLGSGSSGVVYLIYDPLYKREFALKSVMESKFNEIEVDCMKHVDDSNVVCLYNYEFYDGSVYMLMEYCPTSLEKYVFKRNGALNWDQLRRYTIGILKAIRACHNAKVAHLDIKPANFLIDFYDRIRVCDFGLSSMYDENELDQHFAGSVPFMAPEILIHKPHDPFKADIWAIGVTMFIMATGKLPWPGKDRKTICENLLTTPPRLEFVQDPFYASVISMCLEKDPAKRPTVSDLLKLPLFKESETTIVKICLGASKLTSRNVYSHSSIIRQPKIRRTKLLLSI